MRIDWNPMRHTWDIFPKEVFHDEYFAELLFHRSVVLYFHRHRFLREYRQHHDRNASFHWANPVLNKQDDLYRIDRCIILWSNGNNSNVHVVMDEYVFENSRLDHWWWCKQANENVGDVWNNEKRVEQVQRNMNDVHEHIQSHHRWRRNLPIEQLELMSVDEAIVQDWISFRLYWRLIYDGSMLDLVLRGSYKEVLFVVLVVIEEFLCVLLPQIKILKEKKSRKNFFRWENDLDLTRRNHVEHWLI